MFYSEKLNLLFIACPKTGSTSVENFLRKIDPDGQRFKVDHNGKTFTSSNVKSASLGHATAEEFRGIFGHDEFNGLIKFGFIRDPREKLVSTYFFSRGRNIWKTAAKSRSKSRFIVPMRTISGILLARLLPFSIWVWLWPMKQCSKYFLGNDGNILVDYLGLTDRLDKDIVEIIKHSGMSALDNADVPHVNRSRHKGYQAYFQSHRLTSFVESRYSEDFRLFNLVKDDIFINDVKKREKQSG